MKTPNRVNASFRGAMEIRDNISGRAIVYAVKIDGVTRNFIVNHGMYEDIADDLRGVINRQFPDAKDVKILGSGEVQISGVAKANGYHHITTVREAVERDSTPNYDGEVHEIDGRKYRLTLEGDK